eukprot:3071006-Rhodomonas_salina.2
MLLKWDHALRQYRTARSTRVADSGVDHASYEVPRYADPRPRVCQLYHAGSIIRAVSTKHHIASYTHAVLDIA